MLLNTVGPTEQRRSVGWQTGFDSGESLDHVYRNTPAGQSFLGRWIDRFYLDSPGWRGIRQRKIHLQQLLDDAIEHVRGEGTPVQILDIAAGPGRYVLDTIVRHGGGVDISATLCDRDGGGLAAGRKLAEEMGITHGHLPRERRLRRRSDRRDRAAAEDRASSPACTNCFPRTRRSASRSRGLAAAVEPGGLLIYTNQPWHPQQEMIARVLPNRDGDPWVMRCRTQAEMDQLVAAAGFEKTANADRQRRHFQRLAGGEAVIGPSVPKDSLSPVPMTFDHLSPAVWYVFLAIVAALVGASVATILAQAKPTRPRLRELRARVRTWWMIVGLFALAMLLNRGGAILFFAVRQRARAPRVSDARSAARRRLADTVLGLLVHSAAVLVDLSRMVRDVHHLHPGLLRSCFCRRGWC